MSIMKVDGSEASPMKAVLEELSSLRALLRDTAAGYLSKLESEIDEVQARVEKELPLKKIPSARLHDLRDMLTLLRHIQVKPEKGRRKDLKKLDSVIVDLAMLTEKW